MRISVAVAIEETVRSSRASKALTMRRTLTLALLAALSACASAQRHATTTPDALTLDGALANRFVPAATRSTVLARIHLGTAAADPTAHPPINLALVVDTSGSMEGTPIDDARAASLALLHALRDGDRLAVVTFDSRAELLVPSTVLDGVGRAEAAARIGRMRARGTTDMAAGLRMGVAQVVSHLAPGGINRVVLLGDGAPNDAQGIEAMAVSAGRAGVSITSLGLGLEYNESLMGAIAQRSGGRFHYLEDSSSVAETFRNEVLRMERVVARDAVVTLTPGPGVQVEEVLGHEPTRSGAGVTVSLGDVPEGSARDLVVRVSVPSHRAGSPVELVDARLAWADPASPGVRHERSLFLGARATSDAGELEAGRSREVESVAAQVQLAAATVTAIREARDGRVEEAQRSLDTAVERARGEPAPSAAYAQQIARVSSLRRALRPAADAPSPAAAPPQHVVNTAHDEALTVLEGY